LGPIHEKRAYFQDHPKIVDEIIAQGNRNAREVAHRTMAEVRAAIKITY